MLVEVETTILDCLSVIQRNTNIGWLDTCGDKDVSSLHCWNHLAGNQTKEPLSSVQTLDEGGGDADETGRDAGEPQVENVQILGSSVNFLP